MESDKKEAGKALLKALFEKQSFSEEETESRFQMACSPQYWRELNPQLHVCADLSFHNFEDHPLNEEEIERMIKKVKHEGYFATPQPLIKQEIAADMLLAVNNLRKAGWHEVWAFVYDEFWQVTRTPSMLNLLSARLGKKFMALPHVVVHYVHPETGTGWSPHVDFSDRSNRFTIWFSLSDATIDNGCMYLISKHHVSEELLKKWLNMEDLSHKEIKKLLQSTRALPVPAGSVLGWEGNVIHWGTMSSKNAVPRVSLSVVYLQEDMEPMSDEIPLLAPADIPDFAKRMLAVGKAINYYNIHILALNKFAGIGKRLVAQFREQALA